MEFCPCCNKQLKGSGMVDTCMCRPPFCSECGYCAIHDKYVESHDIVHQSRMESINVDDPNKTGND